MPVGRSEGLDYATGDGYSALDAEAARNRLDGYAVVDGLGVSVDTGLTLSVASGSATVGETGGSVDTVSLGSATTIALDTADSQNPRKDVVYIDTSGTVQKETGVAEPADPSGSVRFNTFQPEPPAPSTEGVILAEVWVGAGTSSLASADIRDRRQPAQVVADSASVGSLDAGTFQKVEYTAKYLSGSTSAGIEEAISALPSNGGTVVVGPPGEGNGANGEFEVTDNTPLDGFDNVSIIIPSGSTLRQADGVGFNRIIQLSDVSNVTLEIHGTLDANRTGQSGVAPVNALRITDFTGAVDGLTICGSGTVTGTRRYAIQIDGDNGNGTTNPIIEGLTFEDHRSDVDGNSPHPVLQFDGGADAPVVRDCVFKPVKNNGLHVSMADGATTNGVVENCRFQYDDGQYRIAFMGSDSATFRENVVYPVVASVTGVGDMVRTNGSNTNIDDNVLIGLENTDRGIVLGTTSLSTDQTGVSARGNTVIGLGNPGIEARGNTSGGKVESPVIADNTVLNCNQNGNAVGNLGSAGVALDATNNPRVSDNVIADTQGTATQEHPVIILSSVTDAELAGNQYYGNATENQANDLGTRTRYEGTVYLSGAPTGSNYGAEDAGTEILDTSASPEELYKVLTDGTLSSAL